MSIPTTSEETSMSSRSASAIIAGAARGYHLLKIDGYSRTKDVPNGEHIESCRFSIGSYWWRIHYYPNGKRSSSADSISLYLVLDDTVAQAVKTQFRISPVNQLRTSWGSIYSFTTDHSVWGYESFMKREILEKDHLKDDCFMVRCDIAVLKAVRMEETEASSPFVLVPPSDLHHHLGDLLLSEQGADVKFEVGGETFCAHRCVLGARSPVFKAELFGSMKESTTTSRIRIDDMEPQVFRALLHFIYTDSLSEMNEQEDMMVSHLLVAADRYDIERLKLVCEDTLCKLVDTSTVVSTLELAEQHHCRGLKEACFKFLHFPTNLKAVMATEGFKHLIRSCPSLLPDLIVNVADWLH